MKIVATSSVRLASRLLCALTLSAGLNTAQAATQYWDTAAGSGNGVGGSGTWGTTFSAASTGSASLTTAATADDDIFQGTAGTITLGASQTANSLTFNITGYSITTSGTATRILAGPITLANNVSLALSPIAAAPLTISSVTGGTSSALTIGGSTSASTDSIRINLASGATIASSAPITISTSGTQGIAGFAANSGTATINAGITNNSTVTTSLGATSGNTLNVNAAVTGTAGLQFSAGSGGGAGTINLGAANTYQGATTFNAAVGGLIKLGVDNALPTGTNVTMAASASNGGILDLNGHNQEIASLTSGAGGGNITNGAASGTNTLTISGSSSPAAFGLVIKDGSTAKTALTRSGTGTTILSGANTYTGATSITGGTLTVSGSLGNTTVSLSNAGSTLSSGVNITSAITGGVTAGNGTFLTPGGAGTVGTLTLGSLTMNNGSTLSMDLLGNSNYDQIVAGTLTLGSGVETINLAGSGFSTGNFTLVSGYSGGSGGVFTLGSTPSGFNYSLSTGSSSTILTVADLGGSGSLTWSVNGLAPTTSTDGAGTWTNGGATFYNTGSNATTTWDNTATNALTIGSGGNGGIITLGGNVTVGGALTFAAVTSPYTVGAGNGTNTLTLVGGITANNSATINAPTILEASQTWNVATGNLTVTGAISETGGARTLTKSGVGTLVLTSTSNSYSGGTVLGGGIVSVGSDSNLGNISGGLTFSGGTLQTSAGITSARTVTINSGGGTFDTNSFNSAMSGNITGTGALTKAGSGTLTLSGTNTYGGGTFINAGTLTNNGSYSGTTTLSGGTYNNGGSNTVSGASVAVTVTGNNATITNLGTLSQTGSGRAIRDTTGVTGLVITNGSATNSTALIQTANADVIQMAAAGGSVTLNNYGTMTSLNSSAGGAQVADFNAITTGANTINNYSTGIMQASEADAVRPGVNGVVNNAGTIKSTWASSSSGSSSDGIDAQNNSGVVITNASNWSAGSPTTPGTGTIEGARDGITGGALNSTVTFTTAVTNNLGGVIQGDNGSGINLDGFNANQSATIVNNGTITGNGRDIGNSVSHDGDGIDVDGLVYVTNTGTIRSVNSFNIVADGVAHSEGITVGGGTVTNSGTIEGLVSAGNTNAIGIGISFLGNDITTGPLAGTREAIYGNATVTNQSGGLIRGDSGSGILVDGAASAFSVTINNNAGATIRGGATLAGLGGTSAAIQMGADAGIINNAGLIDGSSNGKAITGGSGGLVVNITGGSASVIGDITGANGVANTMTINPGVGNSFSFAGAIANFNTITVSSGSFTLGGQLTLALNGLTPGTTTGFDQLVFSSNTGALVLDSGASLNLILGFTPAFGDTFKVVDFMSSGTLSGTFGGLSEGSHFTVSGQQFSITYLGGVSGHDVVLTAIPEPSTTVLLFAGFAGAAAFVLRRRRASQV
jgi:autotransporter-associated beta strand protein